MPPLLEFRDLEVSFPLGREMVPRASGVSFAVHEGEIVCLVGESGCGKSVTALSVLGLLGGRGKVSGGEILYRGRDLTKCAEKDLDDIRGREIGMVFQDVLGSLDPVFPVGSQIVESIRRHTGASRAEARERAIDLLRRTGLPDPERALRRYPHQLSGGMRQRAMIAMALSCGPKLLLADEPTTALDVTIQLQIVRLLLELRRETGLAILLITHDIGLVAEMADRVVVMYAGQCVEEGPAERVLSAPAHPYTQALMRAVPSLTEGASRRLYAIPGAVPEDYHAMTGCRFAPRCAYAEGCGRLPRREALPGGDGWALCERPLLRAEGREADV